MRARSGGSPVNFRQSYLEAMLFGKPERVPLMPGGPRESTLRAWHEQGLPEDKPYYDALLEELGLPPAEMDTASPGVSFQMIPTFEEKVLEHKDGHYIVQDWMGAITEISDEYDYTYIRAAKDFVTRKWHKFPVETRRDWEAMRERYALNTQGRVPDDLEERCRSARERDALVVWHFTGPFWQLREWCGFEKLCLKFIEEPDFVQEMIDFWREFVLRLLQRIHAHVSLDSVTISEDMAYKAHCMISPAMIRRFILPTYRVWVEELKSHGCRLIGVDSDGYIGEMIPIWIEAGMNFTTPVEVAAHNDIVAYRREFGRRMAYTGGIDKRAIAAGGATMQAEVMRVVPPLLKEGGYIPGCDHGVPPDVSWPDYVEYGRLLARLCGWL